MLNALTEWNRLPKIPCAVDGRSVGQETKRSMVPIPSAIMVIVRIPITRLVIRPTVRTSRVSLKTSSPLRLRSRPRIRVKKAVNVISPRPPSWMRASRKPWPRVERSCATLMTVRPVTQTALVAVKMVSMSPMPSGETVALGRLSPRVPRPITARKLKTTSWGLLSRRLPQRLTMSSGFRSKVLRAYKTANAA